DPAHLLEDADHLLVIPTVILVDDRALRYGVVRVVFVPGQFLARRAPETVAAAVAITHLQARPETELARRVEVKRVDVVIAHDVLHHLEVGRTIRRVPANGAHALADIHVAARRAAAGPGP